MAVRNRGITFLICFRKRRVPRKKGWGGVGGRDSLRKRGFPNLQETMVTILPIYNQKMFAESIMMKN